MSGFMKSLGVSLSLVGAIALSACAPKVTTSASQTPGAAQSGAAAVDLSGPVRIALLAPSSASNPGAASLGQALVNAARLGAQDLGDASLQLAIYDTAGDQATAARVADRALREGAKIILGPLFGGNTKAIASTAAAAGINIISFSTDSAIAGGPIFLSGFLPEKAAMRIAGFARAKGYGTLGVFHQQAPYGTVALSGAQSVLGNSVVTATAYERSQEGIPPAVRDFAANVRATGPRALMVTESGQALTFVAELLGSEGLTPDRYKYLGLGEWNAKTTLESNVLRGGWFPAPDPNAMESFVSRYQTAYGSQPPPLAVLGYDAVQIAGQLLTDARASGSSDPFSAQAIKRPRGFRGAVGPIRFDQSGKAERGMAILQVDQGRFSLVDRAPTILGAGS